MQLLRKTMLHNVNPAMALGRHENEYNPQSLTFEGGYKCVTHNNMQQDNTVGNW